MLGRHSTAELLQEKQNAVLCKSLSLMPHQPGLASCAPEMTLQEGICPEPRPFIALLREETQWTRKPPTGFYV